MINFNTGESFCTVHRPDLQEELRLGRPGLLHPGQQRFHHNQREARAHRKVLRGHRRHHHGLPGAGQDIQVRIYFFFSNSSL